jgi:protein-serine/threonine kinase
MAKTDISEVYKGAKTFCGSIKYLAPEMLKKVGHG